MVDREIIATFDTVQTARVVTKALNTWFHWVTEGDPEDAPDVFEDFGIEIEDFTLDRDTDVDWHDIPVATQHGNKVEILIDASGTLDTLEELLETVGAYDVNLAGEEDED